MARLFTCGWELQKIATNVEGGEDYLDTPAISTATVRSGLASLSSPCNVGGRCRFLSSIPVQGRTYFARTYFRFTAAPSADDRVILAHDSSSVIAAQVWLNSSGQLKVMDSASTVLGTSAALTANTWYRVEMEVVFPAAGNGTIGLYIDGALIARSTNAPTANTTLGSFIFGAWGSGGAPTFFFDDVAINDDQGANQNTLPGSGKIVLLKPVSDSARTGFTGGGGATTNLFDAVNNTPPVGVASTGTNASQIGSVNSNTTDNYQANMGAYTTAVASGGGGMGASDTVKLVHCIGRGAAQTTTARTFGIQSLSNPSITEGTQSTGTTAGGTEPTGWTTRSCPTIAYAPSVTLGTSPVVEVRKATATANNVMCDLMGLVVEYVPGTRGKGLRVSRSAPIVSTTGGNYP